MSKEFFISLVSFDNPLTRYILGVLIILVSVFVIRYIAFSLQWTTEKILKKNQFAKGWVNLIFKHKIILIKLVIIIINDFHTEIKINIEESLQK